MGKLKIALAVCAVLLMSDAASSDQHAEESTAADITGFFHDVVLGKSANGRIVKWTKAPVVRLEVIAPSPENYDQPVRVETPPSNYEFVARHVANLRELTSLPIRLLPRGLAEGGDIVVTITPWHLAKSTAVAAAPQGLVRRLMGPGRCFFVLWTAPEKGITKAQIVINSKLDKNHINHCFLEEITHSMGLPFDSDRVRPSIFNEASREAALSETDAVLIRTLYDPRLLLGMDGTTADVWARSIIERSMMRADWLR